MGSKEFGKQIELVGILQRAGKLGAPSELLFCKARSVQMLSRCMETKTDDLLSEKDGQTRRCRLVRVHRSTGWGGAGFSYVSAYMSWFITVK